jgi:hypothetical protein
MASSHLTRGTGQGVGHLRLVATPVLSAISQPMSYARPHGHVNVHEHVGMGVSMQKEGKTSDPKQTRSDRNRNAKDLQQHARSSLRKYQSTIKTVIPVEPCGNRIDRSGAHPACARVIRARRIASISVSFSLRYSQSESSLAAQRPLSSRELRPCPWEPCQRQ